MWTRPVTKLILVPVPNFWYHGRPLANQRATVGKSTGREKLGVRQRAIERSAVAWRSG